MRRTTNRGDPPRNTGHGPAADSPLARPIAGDKGQIPEPPPLVKLGNGYWGVRWYVWPERHSRTFGKNRDVARHLYAQFRAEWYDQPEARDPDLSPPVTIRDAWARFEAHASTYYRRADGARTGEAETIGYAMKAVLELFGDIAAASFTPRLLRRVVEYWVEGGCCLQTVNGYTNRVRGVWRWFGEQELVSPEVWAALKIVRNQQPSRSAAPMHPPVDPVADEVVERTLAVLPATLADMVRVQRLSAMRPGEVVAMTADQIDRSRQTWVFLPKHHKTSYRGQTRVIPLGPRCRAILQRYLRDAAPSRPLFRPGRAERERDAANVAAYVPPEGKPDYRVSPSYLERAAKADRDASASTRPYTVAAYRRAIDRACTEHGIPHWNPNQLRHSAATAIRAHANLEAARAILGHSGSDITTVYAQPDFSAALSVAEELG